MGADRNLRKKYIDHAGYKRLVREYVCLYIRVYICLSAYLWLYSTLDLGGFFSFLIYTQPVGPLHGGSLTTGSICLSAIPLYPSTVIPLLSS
jgi:hypothetical protein